MRFNQILMAAATQGGGLGDTYIENAVDFNGSTDYLSKAADLTGNADSTTGILSIWFRLDGGDAAVQEFIHNESDRFQANRSSSDKVVVYIADAAGSSSFRMESSTSYTTNATWRHLLASWDTNFSAGNKLKHLYINDANDIGTITDSSAAFTIDYTRTAWTVARFTDLSIRFFNGGLSEVYFAPGQFLDFSNSTNRRKFIDAGGKPVNLGADGSTPTGTAPLIYLKDPAATVGTNSGSGGDFTINGAPATASTTPSS